MMPGVKRPTAKQTPVSVAKVGYLELLTEDVDHMVDHYTKAMEFVVVEKSHDAVFLTTDADHHSVVIRKGKTDSRSAVGYQIAEDVTSARTRLAEAGYKVELRTDSAPSIPQILVLEEPLTGTPIHLYDEQASSGITGYTPLRPTKLGHIAAYVPNLAPVQQFYEDLLGFRWSDTMGDFFVFLRCNKDHHAANFIASPQQRGLHHVAFEMRDLNHLQSMLDYLGANNIKLDWGPGRHGPGHNIFTYHKDPDGNVIELFTQLDQISDEALGYFEPRPWHEEFPQYPKTWEVDLAFINRWGPIELEQLEQVER